MSSKKTTSKKNIFLILVLIIIAGSIYYLNSQKVSVSVTDAESDANAKPQTAAKAPETYVKDEEAIKQKEAKFIIRLIVFLRRKKY